MLGRMGGECARATSIVRYAPVTHFPHHQHPGGEEILVLSGTFSEGGLDYQAGWYLRNPPGSSHRPHSHEGAVIFVKLQQMQSDERDCVRIDTRAPGTWRDRNGRRVCNLFSSKDEDIALHRLDPGELLFSSPVEGVEILVLTGKICINTRECMRGSWIRLPRVAVPNIVAGSAGATLYLRIGAHIGAPG